MLPLATTAYLAIKRQSTLGSTFYAAVAAAGALAAQAALHITCPSRTAMAHLLVFHTGGVLLAAMIGAMIAGLPALRARAGQ